jgi:hypothetical protein
MASQFDESDFVDGDFVATQKTFGSPGFAIASPSPAPTTATHSPAAAAAVAVSAAPSSMNRPPSREEIESKVNETQARLAELRHAQELLERERAALEEARRKRIEFQNGREEMLQHLTRGIGILDEAEFNARRNAEQMKQTVADMRAALEKIQAMNEEGWTEETWQQELTKALTTLENARMEWNSARVKWTILDGALAAPEEKNAGGVAGFAQGKSFAELCKLGLALTWPVAAVALIGVVAIVAVLLLRK